MRRWTALALGAALIAAPAAPAHAQAWAHPDHPSPTATSTAPAPNPVYGKGWKALKPIGGGPRQEHAVAAVNGQVYLIGGIEPDGAGGIVTTPRMEVYDTRRDTWSEAAPLPVPMNHPNVAAVGGKIYVLGALSGGSSWQALRDSGRRVSCFRTDCYWQDIGRFDDYQQASADFSENPQRFIPHSRLPE